MENYLAAARNNKLPNNVLVRVINPSALELKYLGKKQEQHNVNICCLNHRYSFVSFKALRALDIPPKTKSNVASSLYFCTYFKAYY